MNGEILYDIAGWILGLALLALLGIGLELGFRVGSRNRSRTQEDERSVSSSIQASVLGLLALMLAFTFSMATTRYDVRKQLVLDEANAIGTTYLRAKLLSEPHAQECEKLLRQYVNLRLDFFQAGIDSGRLREADVKTAQVHEELWSHARAASAQDPRAVSTGLFVQSLNDVIDLHSKRVTALGNHVPETILLLLTFVAILSTFLTGYVCGLVGSRHLLPNLAAIIAITAIVLLIVDLDRPRRGLIQVSQQSMIDLRDNLDRSVAGS